MDGFHINGGIEYAKGLETEFKAALAVLKTRLKHAEGESERLMINKEMKLLHADRKAALKGIGRSLF